ncbi:zinc finger and BTB domain-containing protein 6-like [Cheilinus undulatus]|uniref:zinc finger and BTB domain-containing protein 6-like n=1 Tax=Cheilinus undulatus TaxID=241271 RepID=UPI001BD3328A|nr:zinc finger and BTB domain-containing protein 6-like [Cheilinus undulatus]
MPRSPDTLLFRLPAYSDSILNKMNVLREKQHFCDITLLLGGLPGTPAQSLHFHGHRVVLAASSDFLRDQFLLHEGQAELRVGAVSSVEVGRRLLLSCYTGLLEVPLRELVSYLTAASALQMTQVAEKCAQAISKYLSPTLAFLRLDRNTDVKEIHQPDRCQLNSNLENKEERDTAQPGSSNQEASTEECKMAVIQSKTRVIQGHEVENEEKEVRDDDKKEISTGEACCLSTLEEAEDIMSHTNNQSYRGDKIIGGPGCRQHPPTPTSVDKRGCSAQLVDNSQKQNEEEEEEKREEEMFLLTAKFQECGELTFSDLTEDSDSQLVQRPYLCRRCDRVFQHLESYVGHLKEHRQYLCLVCGKGFSQKSNLTRHIRVHTGVKPLRCPLCHNTFSQKTTLQDHFNLHTGNRPHKCHYSGVQPAHKLGLKCHLKGIHGEGSLQNVLEEAVDL